MRRNDPKTLTEDVKCVLIGDIRHSRELPDWSTVFQRLQGLLRQINRQFEPGIVVPFTPTAGDEFQGVLETPADAYDMALSMKFGLPARFYLGIGVGTVEQFFDNGQGMRGTAFYRARAALEESKQLNRTLVARSSEQAILIDDVLNVLLRLIGDAEDRCTERQLQVIALRRACPNATYAQLGRRLGMTKQGVHDVLKATQWESTEDAESTVRRLLRLLGEGSPPSSQKALLRQSQAK